MAIVKEVVVGRKYTVNGEEKTQWTNIGRIIEKDGKQSIKLDVIPINWDGFASLFDPKPKEGSGKASGKPVNATKQIADTDDDGIPF